MRRANPETSILLMIDMQERLWQAMPEPERSEALDNAVRLVQGSRALGVPVVATEQYPRGLGPTVEPLRGVWAEMDPPLSPIDKVEFDTHASAAVRERVEGLARRAAPEQATVIVCGLEAHICVMQTARGLIDAGYAVQVVQDAVCSRRDTNRLLGLQLCERLGASITSTETLLFDMLGSSEHPAFKAVSRLLR